MKKLSLILVCSFLLFGCGAKKTSKITPTPVPRTFELQEADKPEITLSSRDDGHMLYLKISKIPSFVASIEYELLYNASESGMEIEKGLGDTLKVEGTSLSRDLLLGTESCTSGCKYKYDEGITGGTLNITLVTKDNQVAPIQKSFTLKKDSKTKKFLVTLTDALSPTDTTE